MLIVNVTNAADRGGARGRAGGGRGRGRHRARGVRRRGRRAPRRPRRRPPRRPRATRRGRRGRGRVRRAPTEEYDRCGSWSGWATPARPTPATGTTSATSSPTSWPPGWDPPFRAHKSGRADVVEGRLGDAGPPGPRVVLARPRGYMNESGGPVKALATFYKVAPERIVAIHDELDIPFGTLRVKLGGGDNGHNGLRSMRSSLGTGDFYRVRVGDRPAAGPPGRRRLRAVQLLDGRAQGAAVPGGHGRGRRRVPGHRGARAETQQRFNS